MYLDEYLTKPWLSAKEKKMVTNIPNSLNPTVLEFIYISFSKYIYFVMDTECQVLINAKIQLTNLQNRGHMHSKFGQIE